MNIFESFSRRLVNISRRRLLLLPFFGVMGACLRNANAVLINGSKAERNPLSSLPSYLDTLIPDFLGPSATKLGVTQHILDSAQTSDQYKKFLIAGCRWLDHMAGKENSSQFSSLSESARIRIIEVAESSDSDTLERVFFERTRRDAFRHYYAQSESWQYLNFPGPPQPSGYPDFNKPVISSANELS